MGEVNGTNRRLVRVGHALLALVVCVVVPCVLVLPQIGENDQLQFLDELAHWDYVQRVGDGELPRLGEPLQAESVREQVCREARVGGGVEPPGCDRDRPPDGFAPMFEQYEAKQPPGHYLLVLPVRWVGTEWLDLSDLEASRRAGLVHLVLGLGVLWVAGRRAGIGPWSTACAVALVAAAPDVVYVSSFVTNDGSAVLAGALVGLAGVEAWRRPGVATAVGAVLAGAVAAMLKVSDVLAVGAVAATLAVLAWQGAPGEAWSRGGRALRRWLPSGGALLGGAVVAGVAWSLVSDAMDRIDPTEIAQFGFLREGEVTLAAVLRSGTTLLNPFTGIQGSPGTLSTDLQDLFGTLVVLVVLGAAVSVLFVADRRWPHWLGAACVLAAVGGGAVIGLGLHLTFDISPLLPGRYGLALAPLMVLAAVAAIRGRAGQLVVGALAVALVVTDAAVLLA